MSLNKAEFINAYLEKFQSMHGKGVDEGSSRERYEALAGMVRDIIARQWARTNREYLERDIKQVYYFSIEYLQGRILLTNLMNVGILEACHEGLGELGINLEDLTDQEPEAGLGSGGLGRLASCFLDSMASLHIPGHGCGIRYRYGMFKQKIVDGYQAELPDPWLKDGNVWEFRKPDKSVIVKFGGNIREEDVNGRKVFHQEGCHAVMAVPYDMPVAGYHNNTVNTLRLWSAEVVPPETDEGPCSNSDYIKEMEYRRSVESISEILYPDDTQYEGRVLRLKQQYFMVSAGLQSIVRRYKKRHGTLTDFHEKISLHINDTHPVVVVPELMRILIDEEGMTWDDAWRVTTNTVSYTNHTVMPEAFEKWPVDVFKELLPRIHMIVYEINERWCRELWTRYPGEWDRIREMAIIADGYVRMANLAVVGSYSVNGVAKIHTEILKKSVLKRFYEYSPSKFNNKTNGITHRRWLMKANPDLSEIITEAIGKSWMAHATDLLRLVSYAEDPVFAEKVALVKLANKERLAAYIKKTMGQTINPHSIFDCQVKRIHNYKRQVLNVMHIMDLANRLRENPALDITPRTFIFAGKAAPGYYQAKRTIKLINTVAEMVDADPALREKIKVVFLENYRVSLAEIIMPAADVSEQISTASKEASGTGNMKFMMNGAITIGTHDGANIEIRSEVGTENFVAFGLTADEVMDFHKRGGYNSRAVYEADPRLKKVVDQLVSGELPAGREEFRELYDGLLAQNDEFFLLEDFCAYVAAHDQIDHLYKDASRWRRMCIQNIAHSGEFSSDNTIWEYAVGIWQVKPVIY
ncbi:MAG TPA: glycogen/starch/alpha-glucan phosphorylase [Negativicutes bacterium]|nr:glycogen/starch/alpha-glucan phosphorylase [Negativicutes bacterium]